MRGFITRFFKSPQFGGTEDFFKQVVSEILKDRRQNPRVSYIPLIILIITKIMFSIKKYSQHKCLYARLLFFLETHSKEGECHATKLSFSFLFRATKISLSLYQKIQGPTN